MTESPALRELHNDHSIGSDKTKSVKDNSMSVPPDFVVPKILSPTFNIPKLIAPAESIYKRMVKQIIQFESKLSSDEELGGRFVTAPRDGPIHILDIGYWGPDMLIFHGQDADGRPIELLQHYTQMSVLLCVVPKEKEKPRRIGFILEQRLTGDE
jgi:hypothetical protein